MAISEASRRPTRHSRGSGNPETFATGRLALGGQPWIPAPRSGPGTSFAGIADDPPAPCKDMKAAIFMAISEASRRPTRHSRGSGNPETFATGRLALGGQPWIPAPRSGPGTSFAGIADGPPAPRKDMKAAIFMAISEASRRPTRHSRGSGNPETFATGRLALGGQPWIPAPRSGPGTSFAGIADGPPAPRKDMKAAIFMAISEASRRPTRHSRESGNPEAFATGRLALGRQRWIPAFRSGPGTSFAGMTGY